MAMVTTQRLALAGEFGIVEAAALRSRLIDALGQEGDLLLDLGQVESCDSAGLQLLLALRRSLAARGDTLRLVAASDAVRQAIDTYALQAVLPLQPDGDPA